jgi:hypothetical protein
LGTFGICAAGAGPAEAGVLALDGAAAAEDVTDGIAAGDEAASAAEGADDDAAASCGGNSFTGATPVVLGSGAVAPIDSIHVGDRVLATNVITGKSSAKTVQKLWVNHDTDLMDVTVTSHGTSSVIHATQHHLFWDELTKTCVEADRLHTGDALLSDNGMIVRVAATRVVPAAHDMWDLTVASDHDFYIVTASAAVLVHNCPNYMTDMDHIWKTHGPGADIPGKGEFAPGTSQEDVQDMIDRAQESAKPEPNPNGEGGEVYDYDVGRTIGTTGRGALTSKIRVYTDQHNFVTTATPRQ